MKMKKEFLIKRKIIIREVIEEFVLGADTKEEVYREILRREAKAEIHPGAYHFVSAVRDSNKDDWINIGDGYEEEMSTMTRSETEKDTNSTLEYLKSFNEFNEAKEEIENAI